MNVKLRVLSAGALFFIGSMAYAQTKKDTLTKEAKIEEVVVTGYRTKKADEIIQAQSVISSKEFSEQQSTLSLTNMLQAKAPGVFVQASTGKPGDGGSIQIRGLSGLGNADPLVVIDGMYSSISQFNALNPSDVESVTVLKDAASTAQYGSRAAAGVLVVTTKKGGGKPTYMLQTRFGFSKKISDKELNFQMMNSSQKLNWENSIAAGVGIAVRTPEEIAALSATNNNWEDLVLGNSSEESYLFSASGGTKKDNYYYSIGYDHNSGIVRNLDALKRYSARFNFDNQLSDRFKIGVNTSMQYQMTDNNREIYNSQNPIHFMYNANPYDEIYNPDGSYSATSAGFPFLESVRTNPSFNRNLRLNGSLYGEFKITDYLKFRSTGAGTYAQLKGWTAIFAGSTLGGILGYPNGQLQSANNSLFNYTINNRLDFDKSFGQHNVNATVFQEFYSGTSNTMVGTKKDINNTLLSPFQLSNYATPLTTTGTKTVYTLGSFAGLVDYNYDKKYFLSGSLRRDGSSRFGADKKYGQFWSISGGWNVANENFLADTKLSVLKLRASYGTVGNDATLPDYVNRSYGSFGLYGTTPTILETQKGNEGLKWEVAKMQNYGVDFVYAGRLRGSFEYFRAKRSDFLQAVSESDNYGGYTSYKNVGDLENKGIEAELSYEVIKNSKFSWNVHGNITNVQNKLLKLNDNVDERVTGFYGDSVLKVGEMPFIFKLVKFAGVDAATGDALYYTNRTTANAGETFYDLDGGRATNVYNSSDVQNITDKSPAPKIFGGFGTSFRYEKFDLSAEFAYKFGGWALNYAELDRLDPAQYNSNKSTDAANFWQNPGDTNVLQRPTDFGMAATDQFLQKTDYIRFRSLSVGYTFDKDFLGDVPLVQSFRVYVQGQNLYTWTKFKGDPESAAGLSENTANFVPGSYYAYSYPNTKTFSVGIDIKF